MEFRGNWNGRGSVTMTDAKEELEYDWRGKIGAQHWSVQSIRFYDAIDAGVRKWEKNKGD